MFRFSIFFFSLESVRTNITQNKNMSARFISAPSTSSRGQLTFSDAKTNLRTAIHQYRGLENTFVPNSDARDRALLNALSKATTWTQLGMIGTNLSPRFALLQKPIGSLGKTYVASIVPRFDEGIMGWYWLYGSNLSADTAFLLTINRYPSAKHSTALQTFYSVYGYIISNGVTMPFSTLGTPILCPGTFTTSESEDRLTLAVDLSMYLQNEGVKVETLSVSGTLSTLKSMQVNIKMKSSPVAYVATMSSNMPAEFEGKNGCSPCIDGAGFNYWSFTDLNGGTSSGFSPGAPSPTMIGWFDHQWFNPMPKSALTRAFMTVGETLRASPLLSWIFLSMHPSSARQYMVYRIFTEKELKSVAIGNVYKASSCTAFVAGQSPRFGVQASIKILGILEGTPLPNHLLVTIKEDDGETAMTIQTACDGRVTLPNGAINLEAVSKVMDGAGKQQLGIGCIEVNNFTDFKETAKNMMALAGLEGPVSLFMPKKTSVSDAGPAIAAVTGIIVVPVIILACLIALTVFLIKRKHKTKPAEVYTQHKVSKHRGSRRHSST